MLVLRGLGSTTILTDGLGGKTSGNHQIFVVLETQILKNVDFDTIIKGAFEEVSQIEVGNSLESKIRENKILETEVKILCQ